MSHSQIERELDLPPGKLDAIFSGKAELGVARLFNILRVTGLDLWQVLLPQLRPEMRAAAIEWSRGDSLRSWPPFHQLAPGIFPSRAPRGEHFFHRRRSRGAMPSPTFRLTLVLEVDGQPYSFVLDGDCSIDLRGLSHPPRFKLLEAHVTRQESRRQPAAPKQKPRPLKKQEAPKRATKPRASRKPGPPTAVAQKAP